MRRRLALSTAWALLVGACAQPELPRTSASKPEGEFALAGYRGVVREGDGVRYVFDPGRPLKIRMTSRVTAAAARADFHPFLLGLRVEHHGAYHFQRWPKWARRLRGEGTVVLLVEEFDLGHWPTRLTDDPVAPVRAALSEIEGSPQGIEAALISVLAAAPDPWARGWAAYEGAKALLRVGTATAADALLAAELPRVEAQAPGTLPAALCRLRARAARDPASRAAHLEASAERCPKEDRQEALRWEAERAETAEAKLRVSEEMASFGAYADAVTVRLEVAREQAAAGRNAAAIAALEAAPLAYASDRVATRARAALADLGR